MTNLQTMLVLAVALTVGGSMFGVDPAHAQLGNGSAAIGRGPPDAASSKTPQAGAPRAVGSCITNRTAFRTQTNAIQRNAPVSFFLMDNTHVPVTHAAGCLIVDFAGEMYANTNAGTIRIRASIVGIGVGEPPEALIGHTVDPTEFETRSMRFVFPDVPAGTHTVRIDWRTDDIFATLRARNRTLTVQHR